jgi:hypothetical protein
MTVPSSNGLSETGFVEARSVAVETGYRPVRQYNTNRW